MRILKVSLKNVKSYTDGFTVEFMPGVNFLTGMNGAGKSTLIEAIGFALYDFLPYEHRDFLRRGERTGVVQVEIEDQGETFRIQRKFGSSASWVVFDRGDVALHDRRDDVRRFLAQRLNLPSPDQLENVFSNIVGVQQGKFTVVFTETPANRKKILDAVINVDVYRNSVNRHGTLKNQLLPQEIERVSSDLRLAQAWLDEHRADPGRLAACRSEAAAADVRIHDLKAERASLAARQQAFEQAKAALDEADRRLAKLAAALAEQTKAAAQAQVELAAAREAAAVCAAAAAAHAAFQQAELALGQLEKQRLQRDALRQQLAAAEQRFATAGARIETLTRSLAERTQEAKTAAEKARTRAAGAQAAQVEAATLDQTAAAADRVREGAEAAVATLQQGQTDLAARLQRARAAAEQVRERLVEAAAIGKDLVRIDEVEARAGELAGARRREKVAQDQVVRLEAAIAENQKNRKELADLTCPFIKERCERVAPKVFDARLVPLRAELVAAKGALEAAEAERATAEAAKNDLAALRARKEQLAAARRSRGQEWAKARSQFADWTAPWGELPAFPDDAGGELDLAPFEELARALATELERRRKELRDEEGRAKKAGQAAAAAGQKAATAQEHAEAARAEVGAAEGRVRDVKDELAGQREAEAEAGRERGRVETELKVHVRLDAELAAAVGLREEQRAGHERYARNEAAAAALPRREQAAERAARAVAETTTGRETATRARADLAAAYDAAEAGRIAQRLDDLGKQLGSEEADQRNRARQIAELEEVVARMKDNEVKIGTWATEKRRLERLKVLVEDIWKVLSALGPRVSARLLAGIAARANRIFGHLHDQPAQLVWGESYEVRLRQGTAEYPFRSMSGGEQMSAALAIQMAMARDFAGSRFCIFDEPTVHLDEGRRARLAAAIRTAQAEAGFTQVFVVSHDETFGPFVDHAVRLRKTAAQGTEVVE